MTYNKDAKKNIFLADHILTQTYPLVNEPKILLSVIEYIYKANLNIIEYLLTNLKIPYHKNDESKINAFKNHIVKEYHINIEYITLVEDIRIILQKHKKSPVEFTRKDKFIICSETYNLRTISVNQMKKYIRIAKIFLMEAENIVRKKNV